MESLFTIPIGLESQYALFYRMAFIVGGLLVLYEGYRRNWPLCSWLIVIFTCVICGIIGSKLLVLSPGDFDPFLSDGVVPSTTKKTYLGAILGGIIGVGLIRRWLGFRHSVADAFVIAVPVALAVGRIGCLLGGCCFGTPTDLPWAISYAGGSMPYAVHNALGLLQAGAITSVAGHPTQMYEIIACLVLIACLGAKRDAFKAPGNAFYVSVISYGIFRFMEEFIREGGVLFWGLKSVQWGLVPAVLCVTIFVLWKERRWRDQPKKQPALTSSLCRNLTAVAGILVCLWIGRHWFTPLAMPTTLDCP